MPRIDPLSLLKCLSVLLGPTGGIKSREEVHRLANLMTKFSKKLVSKCIYIQILKTTNTDLLSQFMSAGGWNLIHTWLTDGILAKNWALIQELLELLLLCPVDIERLKSNNCPKLIKGLSKEGSHQGVRTLASRLVEQWLKIVKGEAAPNSVPAQIMTVPAQSNATVSQSAIIPSSQQQHSTTIQQTIDTTENATVHVQDFKLAQQSIASTSINQDQERQQQLQERLQPQTVQVIGKGQGQQQVTQQQCKKQSFVVVSTSSTLPVYKITIRDGNQVLAKVETDAANINNILNATITDSEHISDATQQVKTGVEELDETVENGSAASGRDDVVDVIQSDDSGHVPSEVKQTVVSSKDNQEDSEGVKSKDIKDSKDIISSDSGKSSDKENRDSHKKDDKKSSSSDKKSSHHSSSSSSSSSSKNSKHGTSSSAHRSGSTSHKSSSHRSSSSSSSKNSSKDRSSKDKDKHHSSSSSKHSSSRSKSERDKEREKEREKQKKDQAEKDKATLEKVQGQALSSKLGKIPKKKTEDEKSGDASGRKSSIESRDGSKENKEKVDSKKDTVATKLITEKKNISISIENRKNSQDSGTRPKTVKTFNSKFRSTGLEEEVKPPPPRSKKAAPVVDKKVLPPKLPVKRPSPLRDVPLVEKRAKILDSPTTPPSDEKKGGIKLIPAKPKPMMLQESDMFMDALTASTKSKEPRKRKRRASITKEGSSEAKKQEVTNADNRESTPPPASPSNTEEKSPVAIKPNFKFYQDTLEIEEDKDQREKEIEDESKRDKDQMLDEEKDNRDDDDSRSNTPTPEEDVEEIKDVESPEDASSVVSDSGKKDSYPEIRYVDGLKSVLLLQKRKGPKKVLKWKTDLESIRYFELDETERVNVTKTFTDMKQMEKQNEREAFQMARKLNTEDLMEEKTRWKPLIPVDLPPPLVEPGKDSKEKDVQYAREKGILQALYFNRSMIPDSAAEPDEERHHVMTDPKIIPLDDLTGNKESEKDFTAVPWPEPKPQPPQPSTVTTFHYPTTYPHNQQNMLTTMGPQSTMGPMPQIPQQMMAPTHMAPMSQEIAAPIPTAGGGGWRTGDGKVLVPDVAMNPMANMSGGFNQGMEGGPMVPPGMMGPPPMYNQENYGMMCPDDMGYNNFQGPPGPMYGPGPNFPGPRGAHMHNRGRGGPGWGYRGPVRGGWRGVGGGWRGSGKQPPVCRQFSKNGYCRVGDKCQYLHPGVNCPPF